jgi:hypothetical protein
LAIFTDVEITGMDPSGDWYRIKYSPVQVFTPGLPGNTYTGWVASEYIQVEGVVDIPVIPSTFNDQSIPPVLPSTQLYQTQTVSGIPTPLALPSVATEDGDTVQNPLINIDFSPTGARSITYTGDVSFPQGDLEDWLKFRPYMQSNRPSSVSVIINCAGTNGVNIELQQAAQVLQTWENTSCKATARLILSLYGNAPYFFRIRPGIESGGLNYVRYTITIQQDD